MKPVVPVAIAAALALAVLGVLHQLGKLGPTTEQKVELLDPARVQVIRTPGGFLQVTELRKVEEFAWQTGWDCPFVDCSALPKTISRIRVKAHYVYRIPLADEWRLEPDAQRMRLTVPPLQLQAPVGFDTSSIEVLTMQKSILSPSVQGNREQLLRRLGPELAQRGGSLAYTGTQQNAAEETVREFARKWMGEQGKKNERPIDVRFNGPNPA